MQKFRRNDSRISKKEVGRGEQAFARIAEVIGHDNASV
jgi:hypothetical protein